MPTLTLTMTAANANRASAALGKSLGLKDENGQLRSATTAEAEEYLRKVLIDLTRSVELQEAQKSAIAGVSVTEISVT